MARRQLKDGDLVHVTSKRGAIVVPLQASPEVAAGHGQALAAREQLKPLRTTFAFSSSVPFSNELPLGEAGRQRTGVLFRAADFEAPPAALLEKIEAILRIDGADVLRYADKKKTQHRSVRRVRTRVAPESAELANFLLAGDVSTQAWIKAQVPA